MLWQMSVAVGASRLQQSPTPTTINTTHCPHHTTPHPPLHPAADRLLAGGQLPVAAHQQRQDHHGGRPGLAARRQRRRALRHLPPLRARLPGGLWQRQLGAWGLTADAAGLFGSDGVVVREVVARPLGAAGVSGQSHLPARPHAPPRPADHRPHVPLHADGAGRHHAAAAARLWRQLPAGRACAVPSGARCAAPAGSSAGRAGCTAHGLAGAGSYQAAAPPSPLTRLAALPCPWRRRQHERDAVPLSRRPGLHERRAVRHAAALPEGPPRPAAARGAKVDRVHTGRVLRPKPLVPPVQGGSQ
jgi:hypothetical protein